MAGRRALGCGTLRLHSASPHRPGNPFLLPDARGGNEPARPGIYLWVEGGVFHQPLFKFGEFLVFTAFAYHAFNGVRLVLVELGFAVGKPIEPIYPYKTSLNVQRPLLISMMILAAIFLAAGGYEFLGLAK